MFSWKFIEDLIKEMDRNSLGNIKIHDLWKIFDLQKIVRNLVLIFIGYCTKVAKEGRKYCCDKYTCNHKSSSNLGFTVISCYLLAKIYQALSHVATSAIGHYNLVLWVKYIFLHVYKQFIVFCFYIEDIHIRKFFIQTQEAM